MRSHAGWRWAMTAWAVVTLATSAHVLAGARWLAGAPGRQLSGHQASQHPGARAIGADTPEQAAAWDARITRMARRGELRAREITTDAFVANRRLHRYEQLYKGVPVFGGEMTRVVEGTAAVAAYGTLYEGIDINPVPKLTSIEAAELLERDTTGTLGPSRPPDLLVLPTDAGAYVLAYRSRVSSARDVRSILIDANTGRPLRTVVEMEYPGR